jgi:hypothetical protein
VDIEHKEKIGKGIRLFPNERWNFLFVQLDTATPASFSVNENVSTFLLIDSNGDLHTISADRLEEFL